MCSFLNCCAFVSGSKVEQRNDQSTNGAGTLCNLSPMQSRKRLCISIARTLGLICRAI